jgi:hypothetical protein
MHVENSEIVAVAEGIADRATELKVTAAALADPKIRQRLAYLRALDLPDADPRPVAGAQSERLKTMLQAATKTLIVPRSASVIRGVSWTDSLSQLQAVVAKELSALARAISLPGLSSALAAPTNESVALRREVFERDGVRIELIQLPGETAMIRILVDAGETAPTANALCLMLHDDAGEQTVVLVTLGENGKGYRDLSVGGDSDALPLARGTVSLAHVALVHVP